MGSGEGEGGFKPEAEMADDQKRSQIRCTV